MSPCCFYPPVSEQKHVLDIEDAPSATCWSVLEGERWPGSQPGRVPWGSQPLWGDTACLVAACAGTCHRCPTALCREVPCSVTAALLLVARACWCLFVASRIVQCFLPVTAPSTSTEGDVGHFLAYKRSELAGERRGP